MGSLTLDFPVEGVFPFHNIDDSYAWGLRVSPRLKWHASDKLTLVVGPAFQAGREDAYTGTGLRFFRYQPDPRLVLGTFRPGEQEIRLDIPEAYLQFRLADRWQVRVGRYYWDNTVQKRMRDWSLDGFTDGNIGDSPISLGGGGDVRYFKPWTEKVPVDVKLSASAAVGSRGEALGLMQGLATFLPVSKYPNSPTVIGASAAYAHYPEGSLPPLLPGIADNAAGDGVSMSAYLQQGLGPDLDVRAGYGAFLPTRGSNEAGTVPLGRRSGLTVSADYHKRYWGLHLNYGRIWRDDLAGSTGTVKEDIIGFSARWMLLGDENRSVNLMAGSTLAFGEDRLRYGVFGGLEINLQNIHF